MDKLLESYRGAVSPWECDVTEHLTVAQYYERFADATLALLEARGVGDSYRRERRGAFVTVACDTRYRREFRNGDVLHIESGLLALEDIKMTVGHRVIDSANGDVCSEMLQRLIHIDIDQRRSKPIDGATSDHLRQHLVTWEGDAIDPAAMPADEGTYHATGRDTVRPWEIDVMGHMGFQFYVHRFSGSGMQLFANMGLSPRWMSDNRCGFSTFNYHLRFLRELSAGDLVRLQASLLHLGNSSIRLHHRLYNARTDELSAELDQTGVLLDLDRRRPKRFPDEIRAAAAQFLPSNTR